MRSQYEPQIFSAVIQHYGIEGQFLVETSTTIFSPSGKGEIISWDEINAKIAAYREFYDGSFNVHKETYDDWISINNQSCLLTPLLCNHKLALISQKECNQLCDDDDERWSIFYWLTRPGFSQNFSQALIQIYAHCPGGPPQYGSIIYLERTGDQWEVKSSYGLYNQ